MRNTRTRELLVILFIVVVAAILRLSNLSALPSGLHGDEAIVGLEARRILKEGHIGIYSPLSFGQPAGPIYFAAITVQLFGNTIFAVRLVTALVGILAVPALYLLLRRNFGVATALLGAALLAVMNWHIHFARVGFPLESWPLVVILTTAALMEAVRGGDWRWWTVAGALNGLGLYAYKAHPLCLAILSLYAMLYLVAARNVPLRRRAGWLITFMVGMVIVALPMALYIANPANDYFSHFRLYSTFQMEEWTKLDRIGPKIGYLVGRYIDFWDRVGWHPQPDFADGTGVTPMIPATMLLLALVGMALGLRFRPRPLIYCGILIILLMPCAAVVTKEGLARRTFALAPFVAMFAAVGVVEIARLAQARNVRLTYATAAALSVVCGFVVWRNLDDYFRKFANAQEQAWVFCEELTDASYFMNKLPAGNYVYFYSDRWSVTYDTRRFLAPDVPAEDRSVEFGRPGFDINPASGKPVFVLIGNYKSRLGELQQLYPGGETVVGGSEEPPTFIAYLPRSTPSSSPAPPAPPAPPSH